MQAGQLRHRVTIEKPVQGADNEYGEPAITWTKVCKRWASIEPLSGREYFQAAQVQSEVSHRIIMRYYAGFQHDWRIKYGSRVFGVVSVTHTGELKRETQLMAVELVS